MVDHVLPSVQVIPAPAQHVTQEATVKHVRIFI